MESSPTLPRSTHGPKGTDWTAVCKEVDALKGEWGKVGIYSHSTATRIRRGEFPSVDATKYEVASKTDEGVTYLWMRRKKRGE